MNAPFKTDALPEWRLDDLYAGRDDPRIEADLGEAARINGELPGQEGPLADHLAGCRACQAAAARLGQAEMMFPVGSAGGVTELRAEWLALAGDAGKATDSEPEVTTAAADSDTFREPLTSPESDRPPPEDVPARGWSRRGGLVGAVRRLAGAPYAQAPGTDRPGDAGP